MLTPAMPMPLGAARIADRHFADAHSVLAGLTCHPAPHTPRAVAGK